MCTSQWFVYTHTLSLLKMIIKALMFLKLIKSKKNKIKQNKTQSNKDRCTVLELAL